ncbi:MAG: isochorismatase family protein [Desulfarculus sp.]|nr:isochorismatase family protein [Desulfarculus sp.]
MSHKSALLSREDCVLVVIDVQEKLMRVMSERDKVAENVLKLVQFAGIIGLPVIFTEQEKLGTTLPGILAEAPGAQPVGKITFDCFASQEFRARLKDLKRRTLLLCGVEAHICVAQTALGGLKDYEVQVVSDAISSRSLHNWVIAVERMRSCGAVITSTEMAMYELLRQAGTEEFKATLPLVK